MRILLTDSAGFGSRCRRCLEAEAQARARSRSTCLQGETLEVMVWYSDFTPSAWKEELASRIYGRASVAACSNIIASTSGGSSLGQLDKAREGMWSLRCYSRRLHEQYILPVKKSVPGLKSRDARQSEGIWCEPLPVSTTYGTAGSVFHGRRRLQSFHTSTSHQKVYGRSWDERIRYSRYVVPHTFPGVSRTAVIVRLRYVTTWRKPYDVCGGRPRS